MRSALLAAPSCGALLAAALAAPGAETAPGVPASVDLRPGYQRYGLDPGDQSGPLCWAFTVAGVLEYEYSRRAECPVRLSPYYLAWAAREADIPNGAGSNFGRAARALQGLGICAEGLVGDADKEGGIVEPSAPARADARPRSQVDARWIKLHDVQTGLSTAQMQAIRQSLAQGHPVAVGMRWPKRLRFEPSRAHLMATPPPQEVFDGHCVVFVGYSDQLAGGAFLFRNSRGPGWQDGGHAWMPYRMAEAYVNDALRFGLRDPEAAAVAVSRAGGTLIEGEALRAEAVTGPAPVVQEMRPFGPTPWSGGKQLFWPAGGTGATLRLTLPRMPPGEFWVALHITRAPDYGEFQTSLNGRSLGPATDGCGPGVYPSGRIVLGRARLGAGEDTLTLRVTGKSPASSGYFVGLDAVELIEAAR